MSRKKRKIFLSLSISLLIAIALGLLLPPRWLINLLSAGICPNAIYFADTNKPIIALTIDDSPDTNNTREILAVLQEYNVVATFFPISEPLEENPELLKEMVAAKHEVGNHLTRDEPSINLKENFTTELDKAHQTLSNFTTVKWMRPGGGWCNSVMFETAKKYNYRVALGSVWSYDTHVKSVKFSSWFIMANTKPGSIIVLHDGAERGSNTVETLRRVIPQLREKGYRFVTLSELMKD